ncbi:MAG: hypothetical protein ACREB3_06605, partial [Burkholderiales bacterium]
MKRRSFLKSAGLGGAAFAIPAAASTPRNPSPMKITRVRFYHNPDTRPMINQSFHIVTVETDAGITGIGEGGSKDGIEPCAAMIIGEDPFRTEHLWQMMFRGYFYPPGREKVHALGAIDLALWDIKGKRAGMPVYQLLGGKCRVAVPVYRHASGATVEEVAKRVKAFMDEGARYVRIQVGVPGQAAYGAGGGQP